MKPNLFDYLFTIMCLLIVATINFLIIAGIYWLLCFCFSIIFTWRVAFGLFIIFLILEYYFQKISKS